MTEQGKGRQDAFAPVRRSVMADQRVYKSIPPGPASYVVVSPRSLERLHKGAPRPQQMKKGRNV